MANLDDILRQKAERARPYAPRADWDRMAALLADDAAAAAALRARRRRRAWLWAAAAVLLLGAAWLGGRYSVAPEPIPVLSPQQPLSELPPVTPPPTGEGLSSPDAPVARPDQAGLPPRPQLAEPARAVSPSPVTAVISTPERLPRSPLRPALRVGPPVESRWLAGQLTAPLAAPVPARVPQVQPALLSAVPEPAMPLPPTESPSAWNLALALSSSTVPNQTRTGSLNFPGLALRLSRELSPRWQAGISLDQAAFAYAGVPGADRNLGSFDPNYSEDNIPPTASLGSQPFATRISGQAIEASAFAQFRWRRQPQARLHPYLLAGTGYYELDADLSLVEVLNGADAPYQLAETGGNLFINLLRRQETAQDNFAGAGRTGQALLQYATFYGGAGLDYRLYRGLGIQVQVALHQNLNLRWQQSGYAFAANPGYQNWLRGFAGLRYTF